MRRSTATPRIMTSMMSDTFDVRRLGLCLALLTCLVAPRGAAAQRGAEALTPPVPCQPRGRCLQDAPPKAPFGTPLSYRAAAPRLSASRATSSAQSVGRARHGVPTGRIVVEVISSGLSLFVGIPAGLPFLAPFLFRFDAPPPTLTDTLALLSAFSAVTSASSAAAVLLTGNLLFGQRGSYWRSWLIGIGSGVLTTVFFLSLSAGTEDIDRSAALLGPVVAAPIGTVIGYELSLAEATDEEDQGSPRRIAFSPWLFPEPAPTPTGRPGLAGGMHLQGTF